MCLVDQLPCGSVLTPAISCTKFKIHSAHADSPMTKTFFPTSIFRDDQSLLHKPRNSGRESAWWTNSLVGQYLHQLSLVQSSRSIQRMQTVPWPKQFFFFNFLGRTSLCFIDHETQEENVLGGPTPLWVSTYTSYLLYKVQVPFSACRQSHDQNDFFYFNFLGTTSLCFTDQETQEKNVLGGPTPLWVSIYTSYLLYKVQDPFSACRQSHDQNVFFYFNFLGMTSLCFADQETQEKNVLGGPTPLWVSIYTSYLLYKVQDPFSACRQSHGQNSFFFQFFREDQSLLHRPRNSGRECAWWTNSLVGQYLHQLSLVQSSSSIQRMQTVP